MSEPTFKIYSPENTAQDILEILMSRSKTAQTLSLAIPGGRTPGPVLEALAKRLPDGIRKKLHLLWLDERCVPLDHADRNDSATLAAWKRGGELPAHVHAMAAESKNLEDVCSNYAKILSEELGDKPIDVCLIGIGEDGHLASLFPNHHGLKNESPVFSVDDSPKPPPRRITLSLGTINRARHRLVIALGEAKGDIYRRQLKGADPSIPASLLKRENTLWYLDEAALSASKKK